MPAGEELKKANEICQKCNHCYLKIENKKCPICGNKEFQKKGRGARPGIIYRHQYKCNNCGTNLMSREEF